MSLPLRGRLPKKPRLHRKPKVPEGNIDQEARELDQFAKLGDLTERELKAVMLMRAELPQITKIAEEIGVSQGYFSKLKLRIIEKLRQGRKKLYGIEPDSRETWAGISSFLKEKTMTEASVTKIVGAVYAAFATMLSDQGLALMNDTLRFAASDPNTSPTEANVLRLIARVRCSAH